MNHIYSVISIKQNSIRDRLQNLSRRSILPVYTGNRRWLR